MAKYQQYDTVLLKDGRFAALVEVFEPDTYIADVGSSPKDWDTVDITDQDIERLATEEEKQEKYEASLKLLKQWDFRCRKTFVKRYTIRENQASERTLFSWGKGGRTCFEMTIYASGQDWRPINHHPHHQKGEALWKDMLNF